MAVQMYVVNVQVVIGFDFDYVVNVVCVYVWQQGFVDDDVGQCIGIDDVQVDLVVFCFWRGQVYVVDGNCYKVWRCIMD